MRGTIRGTLSKIQLLVSATVIGSGNLAISNLSWAQSKEDLLVSQKPYQQECPDPRPLTFPKDHGAHSCFQTEWWYYTGHLIEEDVGGQQQDVFGRPSDYGFQFTVFRRGDSDGGAQRFLAHGALSRLMTPNKNPSGNDNDVADLRTETNSGQLNGEKLSAAFNGEGSKSKEAEKFTFSQVAGVQGTGLAGSSESRLEVWVQDWKAEQFGNKHILEYELKEGAKIRLVAEEVRSPILNGDDGKSRKADCEQCFSYYYSIPQMRISGEIVKGDSIKRVRGIGWMDHEFMSGAMEPSTIGWDWFSLYWPGGASLMAFQLRREGKESYLAGTYLAANGEITKLSGEDISLLPTNTWKSKKGTSYPTGWNLSISKLNLQLKLAGIINGQVVEPENHTSIEPASTGQAPAEYWEGAIEDEKQKVKGYLEMTGYDLPLGATL